MLSTEAIVAEVLGALFVSYSILRRSRSSESMALVTIVWAVILFVIIPITVHYSA